ncbi:hypothetical protein CRG98_042416 [Punica granatum]|uniref:Rab3GAP catalytic subunit conserved domain-containing protein n=1 Tax=Punica granatum TaxID=22663 RepID=A0A2I0HZP8_PUNGR|nr:hypothetical protein CRG98_042416 [Punica granatum]
MGSASSSLYARISSGELVLRLGADHRSDNLYMLETGEPIYSPVMQECPLFTEDLLKETEEFVLHTGRLAGCILEDFVRWHSPPDWTEAEECETDCFDSLSTKGQLSRRMQKEGLSLYPTSPLVLKNRTAKPVPAVKQSPLFDEDLAVEGILNFLEDVPPLELFGQLFVSLLGAGLGIAEFSLSAERGLSMLFYECKEYVLVASQDERGNRGWTGVCKDAEVQILSLNSLWTCRTLRL